MANELIEELCGVLNAAQEEIGDEADVFELAAKEFELSKGQSGNLELACVLQRFDEVTNKYSDNVDQLTDRATVIVDALESGKLSFDESLSGINSVICQAEVLAGREQTPDEVSQCVQDIRQTNAALSR